MFIPPFSVSNRACYQFDRISFDQSERLSGQLQLFLIVNQKSGRVNLALQLKRKLDYRCNNKYLGDEDSLLLTNEVEEFRNCEFSKREDITGSEKIRYDEKKTVIKKT